MSGLTARPFQLGVGLGQVGEFSFVLASVGVALGVVDEELYAAVLGSVVVTIVGSTIVVRLLGQGHMDPDAPAATAASVATGTDG